MAFHRMMFGWPLQGDQSILSGGSWETTLPLGNLQTPELAERAVSTDADLTSTIINIDNQVDGEVSLVALDRHNFRNGDLWRVRVSASDDMSSPTFDSDWVEIWGPQWPVGLLPTGHPNATTRRLTDAQIDAQDPRRGAVMIVPQAYGRYRRIELDVTSNVDACAKIGRLSIGPRYVPKYNFSVGAEFGFTDSTVVGKSMSSRRFYDVRPKGRSMSGTFVNLPDAEAHAVFRDMLEELGQQGQLYWVTNPLDVELLQRRSFLANPRTLSAAQYQAAGYSSVPLTVDEVL